jgi:putative sigma-54 modulation protein
MKFHIRGEKLEVTEAIKSYVEKRIGKLDKYFSNSNEIGANVLIKTHGISQKVEVTIPLKDIILRAEDSEKDLYTAIDLVVEKLERQIRKNKTRLSRKNTKEIYINKVEDVEESNDSIVKRKTIDLKPMNEEEAILQMNLLGHEFFVFENSDTNTNCVLYKRKDNNYGIIEMK